VGQLATWRMQRLNASLALAAALILLQQPLGGWLGAQPWTLLLALAGSAAVAFATARVLAACRPLGGGVIWAALDGPALGSVGGALNLWWSDTARTITSFPACILALLSATAAVGAWQALTAPPPELLDAGVGYVRGLLAAGQVVLAAQAAALVEAAQDARRWTPEEVVKAALVLSPYATLPPAAAGAAEAGGGGAGPPPAPGAAAAAEEAAAGAKAPPVAAAKAGKQQGGKQQQQHQQQPKAPAVTEKLVPGFAPRGCFTALHLGLFASLAMQGAWLALGSTAGLPINSSDPVWALQYWSLLLGACYLVSSVRLVEWGSLWALAINALGWFGSVVAAVLGLTFVDWSWINGNDDR